MGSLATQIFTEGHRIDTIHPASRSDAEATTGWKSMRDFHKAVVIVDVGAIAAGGAVNCKITQATDENGAGAKDVTGKAITVLDGSDDNKVVVIELDASELDANNDYDYINVQLNTGGTVAVLCQATLIRYLPRYAPVDDSNLEEVVN
jgi:hypothetical protein